MVMVFLIGLFAFWTGTVVEEAEHGEPCLMAPSHIEIRAPEKNLVWLPGEDLSGVCEVVPTSKWVRTAWQCDDLLVYADGPAGSGRFWTVTVGIAGRGEPNPHRGFCLSTSTVGWRTLQHFKKAPLRWVDDLNDDGSPELLTWDSFPLIEDASLAAFGLVAWVYQAGSEGVFALNLDMSRKLARELASAYRESTEPELSSAKGLRSKAAQALEEFASGACIVREARTR